LRNLGIFVRDVAVPQHHSAPSIPSMEIATDTIEDNFVSFFKAVYLCKDQQLFQLIAEHMQENYYKEQKE
jgi:hypothetical protein